MSRTFIQRMAIAGGLACIVLATAGRAEADAMYSGLSEATLTLTGLSGTAATNIIALANTNPVTDTDTTTASATATAAATAVSTFVPPFPAVNNDIALSSSVSGIVPAPVAGSATSLASATGGLNFFNLSTTDTAVLNFTFIYRATISASTTMVQEFANAQTVININAQDAQGTVDNFSRTRTVLAANGSSQTNSTTGFPAFLTRTFTITLSPGESAAITFSANVSGSATRLIPEPGSLTLVGLGGVGFTGLALKRRHHRAVA